ncbi:MAG: acetylglutamate kinase, partial [Candidatus Diapherotrites archaeon]|nr:acetylglutamate kinase [Candidatus Diapherotrites archaeon]
LSGYDSVFSDADAIDLMLMSYSGLSNKRFVELCQKNGVNAFGFTGLDGQAVRGKRNSGIKVKEGEKIKLLRDFSGKPQSINKELFEFFLSKGIVPVLSMPIADEEGNAINSENDDVLNVLQQALNASAIVSLIEAPGFLEDKNDENSLVKKISKTELEEREKQVDGRMKRKLLALRKLFENNASNVIISDGRTQNPLKDALQGKGTLIE